MRKNQKCMIFIFSALGAIAKLASQETASHAEYTLLNLLLPGITRISEGDNSGYFNVAGTIAMLGGQAYVLTNKRGLSFDSNFPYALAITFSMYGAHSILYDFDQWNFKRTHTTTTSPPTYIESITYPFNGNILSIESLAIGGIVSLFALYAYRGESESIHDFFTSKTVPLWGMELNPYLSASCLLAYSIITNSFIASMEEIIFRDLLLGDMAKTRLGLNDNLSVLFTAFLFGSYHLGNLFANNGKSPDYTRSVIRQTVSASLMGLALGFFYLLDDSPGHKEGLANATRLHFWNNVVAMNGNYWVSIGKTKSTEAVPVPATSENSGLAFSITPFQISARYQY